MCVVHDPTLFAAAILSIKFCFVGSLRFGKASSQFASAWKSIARIMKEGFGKASQERPTQEIKGMAAGNAIWKESSKEISFGKD